MSWLTATAHLGWHEFRRICRPGSLLLMLGPVALFCFLNLRDPWHPKYRLVGSLTMIAASWLPQAIPLVAGIAGGSLARDIRRGLALTFLARGLSRGQYLLAKSLATAASSGLVILAGAGIFYLMAWVKLPAGTTTFQVVPVFPGPVPALFAQSPLASDLLNLAMCMTAAAALSQVGLLAGSLMANEYVAMATPMLVTLLGAFVPRDVLPRLNPYPYLELLVAYPLVVAESQRPYAAFIYWLAFATCMAALARWRFARRELV